MVFSHMGKAITEGTMLDISNVKLYRLDYVDTDIRNIIDGQITKDVKHRFTFNVSVAPISRMILLSFKQLCLENRMVLC